MPISAAQAAQISPMILAFAAEIKIFVKRGAKRKALGASAEGKEQSVRGKRELSAAYPAYSTITSCRSQTGSTYKKARSGNFPAGLKISPLGESFVSPSASAVTCRYNSVTSGRNAIEMRPYSQDFGESSQDS
jgi:hypothetical protein